MLNRPIYTPDCGVYISSSCSSAQENSVTKNRGFSLIEAIEMGIDAASGWILTEIEEGNTVPKASEPRKIKRPDDKKFYKYAYFRYGFVQ